MRHEDELVCPPDYASMRAGLSSQEMYKTLDGGEARCEVRLET